jgi:hypothetical protein
MAQEEFALTFKMAHECSLAEAILFEITIRTDGNNCRPIQLLRSKLIDSEKVNDVVYSCSETAGRVREAIFQLVS